ncbi:MAG: GAF domain-containing protein [Sulfitobacter sp.]|nr:GAF domain-containing protein [Sulfitobacter sp.]
MNEQHSADLARLQQELVRARERLTATQEILGVVSQSREDEQPVFDAILKSATQLCEVADAALMLLNAAQGTFGMAAYLGTREKPVGPNTEWSLDAALPVAQSFREARTIHVEDMKTSAPYLEGHPTYRHMVDTVGLRTRLCVPLLIGGKAFGAIVLSRIRHQPFNADEIALIETFAAQAVIAIENVRQFREVQKRLEREEASREILQVISASRTDSAPVFDLILRNAAHLSGAPFANLCLLNEARSHWHLVAHFGDGLRHLTVGKTATPLESELAPAVAIRTADIVHIEDLTDTDLYRQGDPGRVAMVEVEGMRTILCVPLLSGADAIGSITLFRREVKAFTSDEIALVETFAAQAVIAIENVRQFRELEARLAREQASRDILQTISESRRDDAPVFEAILGNAARLCNAPMAWLLLLNEDWTELSLAAYHGLSRRALEIGQTWALDWKGPVTGTGIAIREARTVQDEDLSQSESYLAGDSDMRQLVDEEGLRTRITVPLLQGGRTIGIIILSRREVSRFSPEDIRLVDTFAEQAVIAVENVRQYKALERLNSELGERVEAQVEEIERMGKLKRFLPTAVADRVVSSGSEDMLKSHRALLGVLFCDIRGFTAFCETAEPEETIEVLQTYHEEMGKLINDHGAGVDHRMGDGIMVLFNDPLPCEDPAGEAVRLATAMRALMAELCKKWKRMGYRLGFGVGVSLGYATVGMVGFEGRFDYTASGTAVNLASRLCDEAQDGEILLSPKAAIAVEDDYEVVSRGELSLKGLREPLEVFRLAERAA